MNNNRILVGKATRSRRHRVLSAWPSLFGGIVLVGACLTCWSTPAAGIVPSPENCTYDSCLVLDLCGHETYTVVVRDFVFFPMPWVWVHLDFSRAPGIVLHPFIDPDGDRIIWGLTDPEGIVRIHLRGGGTDTTGVPDVEVGAGGVALGMVFPHAYDLSGNLVMDQADVDAWDQLPDTSEAADFNCDGRKDGVDRLLLSKRVAEWQASGHCTGVVDVEDEAGAYGPMVHCMPNPARGAVTFLIRPDVTPPARLEIYDLAGRRVRGFGIGSSTPVIAWDRRSDLGEPVPAGTYFYRLQTGDRLTARRVVLLQ